MVDLQTVTFGKSLPKSPGVFVVFAVPRSADELARGFGELLLVGESQDLDVDIGSGHGSHVRFWWLIAAEAAEIGYSLHEEPTQRTRLKSEVSAGVQLTANAPPPEGSRLQ